MNRTFLTLSASLLLVASLTACSQTSSGSAPAPATSPAGSPAANPASPVLNAASPIAPANSSASAPVAPVNSGGTAPSTSQVPITESNPTAPALTAGNYCYTVKTRTLDGTARLTVDGGDRVSGQTQVTINNPEAGYFSSYQQQLTGTIRGEQLQLQVVTTIEGDVQPKNETWIVTPTGIETGRETYTRVSCSSLDPVSSQPPTVITQPSGRIEFAPGTDSAVVRSGVVRGTRNNYVLRAAAGQRMTLRITSLEDNAVFDLLAPGSRLMQQEATTWSGILPADGDYDIVVGGTRGNATFELSIQIQ